MTELLTTNPQSVLFAIALAVAVDLVRRALGLVAGRARRFWYGPDAAGVKVPWYAEIASGVLLPVLAILAFVPCLVVIVELAVLMGFPPDVKLAMLAHGPVLLWTLIALFLIVQILYVMRLPGFWRRGRYLLLLAGLPLLVQILCWGALGLAAKYHLAEGAPLAIAYRLAHLFSLGLFPFLVPLVHARVLAPVFTFATGQTSRRWRSTATAAGCVVLVGFVIGVFLWFGQAGRS